MLKGEAEYKVACVHSMISIQKVSKAFGSRLVLKDVSFTLQAGEFVGLLGPSGAGKSVLLKVMGGVLQPDSGKVSKSNSENIAGETKTGFLFQEDALFDSLTVIENVAFPLLVKRERGSRPLAKREAYLRSYRLLEQVGLAEAYAKLVLQNFKSIEIILINSNYCTLSK